MFELYCCDIPRGLDIILIGVTLIISYPTVVRSVFKVKYASFHQVSGDLRVVSRIANTQKNFDSFTVLYVANVEEKVGIIHLSSLFLQSYAMF